MLGSFHFSGVFATDSSLLIFIVKLVTEDTLCFEVTLKFQIKFTYFSSLFLA
jgi:hypothetical protein